LDGVVYRFALRASDRWGHQESNTISRSVIPTTPVDSIPPSFTGLLLAQDTSKGGTVVLAWLPAEDPDTPASNVDPSVPIQYLVFVAVVGTSFDLATPVLITTNVSVLVSGLTDGVEYQFLVRSMDAKGNLDDNLNSLRATPTHPYDDTAPIFEGVGGISDLGTGDRVRVTWEPATDPDTPESSVDPSNPVTYFVYVSESTGALGSGTPVATTSDTSVELGGLLPDRTYYVLVRAADAAGNEETNERLISFQVAVPWWSYWWIAATLGGVAASLAAILWHWRRRVRKGERGPGELS
jgi:hypothetical protein